MIRSVYMDCHSTTPVDPRVFEVMRPYFTETFGNPSSRSHRFGWEAEEAVQRARQHIADLVGASPEEIVFTSGATEANNLAIKGVLGSGAFPGRSIVTVATEHPSVLDACASTARRGVRTIILPVDREGLIDLDALRSALTPETALLTVMYGNNEIGVIQPIAEIGRLARERGVLFHCDGVQAAGQLSVDVRRDAIDLLSLSAHKLYGPKGVGVLFVRRQDGHVELEAQLDGGGQERGLRSGTLNVPGIVGMGEACRLARESMPEESTRIQEMRDKLRDRLAAGLDGVACHGCWHARLPNNLSVGFADVDGEMLLACLEGIAVSRGSACSSARKEPSHVLKALGLDDVLAQSTLRFGLGRFTTWEEIEYVAERTIHAVKHLRSASAAP